MRQEFQNEKKRTAADEEVKRLKKDLNRITRAHRLAVMNRVQVYDDIEKYCLHSAYWPKKERSIQEGRYFCRMCKTYVPVTQK